MNPPLLPKNVCLFEKHSENKNSKSILIVGVFHGEEPQGEYVIERYLRENDFTKMKNDLIFVPCLNPWGKERGIRTNVNDVDLNRNYPTNNWKLTEKGENHSGDSPGSEAETKFMIKLLEKVKPDIILTLHAPLKCINFDGPAGEIAEKIAKICNYPVIQDLGYPTPGSFGTYCGIERNIPIVTLEYDANESNESIYNKSKMVFDFLSKFC
jgi:protein MpaA